MFIVQHFRGGLCYFYLNKKECDFSEWKDMQNLNCISAQIFWVSVKEVGGGKRWTLAHWKENGSKSNCAMFLLLFQLYRRIWQFSLKDTFPCQVYGAVWAILKNWDLGQTNQTNLFKGLQQALHCAWRRGTLQTLTLCWSRVLMFFFRPKKTEQVHW